MKIDLLKSNVYWTIRDRFYFKVNLNSDNWFKILFINLN